MKINKSVSDSAKILIAVLILVVASSIMAQEIKKSGRYFVAEITKSFKVSDNGSLRIYEIRGDVRVNSWGKKEVLVKEVKKMDVFTRKEAETILEKSKSSYHQEGNRIEIGGEYYRRDWIQSNFTISVPKSFDVDIHTRGGELSVRNIDGIVEVRTSGGDILLKNIGGEITAKTSGGDIKLAKCRSLASLKTSGGDLILSDIGGQLVAKTSGGDISLARSDEGAELHTSGGSINIKDVHGELDAHTSGGNINLTAVRGNVDVHTSGGDIDFNNVGGSLDASTSGGDINGKGVNGNARVSTSGGSIELKDVKGSVRGKTAGGDIEVEITLTDFRQKHGIDLRTAGGEITLYLPEKIPAQIRAEIRMTNRWEEYHIYSDFPLRSSEETDKERGRSRRRRAHYLTSEGEINGGGDLIELSTTNGDIHIKKTIK